jgi:hypothetical protein
MKALGLTDLERDCLEAALEKKPQEPVLLPLFWPGVIVFCIVFYASVEFLVI